MYKIYTKQKNNTGYNWKLTSTIEADELQVKNNNLVLLKKNQVILVSPARYTQIIKE